MLQPHPSSWLVDAQQKLEDQAYQDINRLPLSPLDSFPDQYYCHALCYRTGLSCTPKMEFGSEAAVSCLLSHHSGEYHPYQVPLVITLQSAPPLDEGHQRVRVMMKPCRIETGCTTGLNAFCGSDTRGHFDYDPPRSSGIVKWNQMFCVIAVYILLSCCGSGSKIDPTCTPCIHVTRSGQGVTWTLLYHTPLPRRGQGNLHT